MRKLLALIGGLLLAGSLYLNAQDLTYPADVFDTPTHQGHVVDVTTYPNVDKTGFTDSTDGLQQAISDIFGHNAGLQPRDITLYFPDGTYLISRSLKAVWYLDTTGSTTTGSQYISNVGSNLAAEGQTIVSADFPAGTTIMAYDIVPPVPNQIKVNKMATGSHTGGALQLQNNAYRLHLAGQSRTGVTIKLGNAVNTSGNGGFGAHLGTDFTSAANPQPMIETTSLPGNQNAFDNCIWNMTLDTGTNNPGAVGILYRGQNLASVRNVTIKSTGATSGYCGLRLTSANPGPCMIENVLIDGFTYGVLLSQTLYGVTFENLTLKDQRSVAFSNTGNGAFIRKLVSTNGNPAAHIIDNGTNSLLVLVDSTITYSGTGTATANAIYNTGSATVPGAVFARKLTTSGYPLAISNPLVTGGSNTGVNAPNGFVSEFSSHLAITPGLPNSLLKSLNLPIEETPFFQDDNMANWYNVTTLDPTLKPDLSFSDQSTKIQNAIDEAARLGKTTLYFPPGRYFLKNPITIHGSIRRILGFGALLMPGAPADGTGAYGKNNNTNLQPLIIVGDMTGDLEIDFFQTSPTSGGGAAKEDLGYISVQHNSTHALTLRDFGSAAGGPVKVSYKSGPGAGKLFLDDVMGAGWYFGPGQKVWGRQVNPEGDTEGIPSVYQAKITNSGGNLWILGLKTEGFGTLVASNSGASTEILGAWAWSVHKPDATYKQTTLNNNLFDVKDSDFSASYMTYASSNNFDYPNQVGQTEGTQTGTLLAATTGTPAMYLRHPVNNASIAPLVVAAPALALDIPGVDIGSVGVAGSGSLVGGLYTLTGSGTDIFGSADGCRFTSEWVRGDCTITAKVESVQNTNANAKAAIMIRSSTAAGSVAALMCMTPSAADFITRTTANTNAVLVGFKTGLSNPYWIRLKRVGNNFTAFRSPDGTTWTQMTTSPQPVNVTSTALVGLAVTSHVNTTLCTSTFSNVSITTP